MDKKETPLPGTAAKDGRRTIGAYMDKYGISGEKTQADFHRQVIAALSSERMAAYGDCQKDPKTVLGRYLLNIALCESLYSPLQFCEVALRNAIHKDLTIRIGTEAWFDSPAFELTPWALQEINKARDKVVKSHKDATPGRIVAELQFGFWTSLFEAHYEQRTQFMPAGIKSIFRYLPKSRHNRKIIKAQLETIRTLRNRVFHHERIVHWTDLDQQHLLILDFLRWVNPELLNLAEYMDRFSEVRSNGLLPWLQDLETHWKELVSIDANTNKTKD